MDNKFLGPITYKKPSLWTDTNSCCWMTVPCPLTNAITQSPQAKAVPSKPVTYSKHLLVENAATGTSKGEIDNSSAIMWWSSPTIGLIFDIEGSSWCRFHLWKYFGCIIRASYSLKRDTSKIAFKMWRHRAKCAILERHESDKIFLTVRLQSQIFFEGIVNKVLPS